MSRHSGWVFLAAIILLLTAQLTHAASGDKTMKLKDMDIGKVVQVGQLKFVKVATDKYLAINLCPIGSTYSSFYKGCVVKTTNFSYTDSVQTFTAPTNGYYVLEVWGAQGGNILQVAKNGGRGGYSIGFANLHEGITLYVYVGGQGTRATCYDDYEVSGGGGASDIALRGTSTNTTWNDQNHFYSRFIVAGGGGGTCARKEMLATYNNAGGGTQAPGLTFNNISIASYGTSVTGPNQINGGSGVGSTTPGSFGYASPYDNAGCSTGGWNGGAAGTNSGRDGGGPGGGWYGGAGHGYSGTGGSGWVYTQSTYNYWVANSSEGKSGKWIPSDSYYLFAASTTAGNQSFPSPSGSQETGHTGHGAARITQLAVYLGI